MTPIGALVVTIRPSCGASRARQSSPILNSERPNRSPWEIALAKIDRFHQDIIILDVEMPEKFSSASLSRFSGQEAI